MESKTTPSASADEKIGELERQVRALTARLEASRRRARRLVSIVACAIAVTAIAGGAAMELDQFSRLDVLGPNNDVRVSINVNPVDSGTGINLFDVKGARRLLIGVDPQGNPEILFLDPTGQKVLRAIRP